MTTFSVLFHSLLATLNPRSIFAPILHGTVVKYAIESFYYKQSLTVYSCVRCINDKFQINNKLYYSYELFIATYHR